MKLLLAELSKMYISFTLDGIPYAPVMFLYALRKKLHPTFLLLKTHATPIPAHFKQNTPKKCQEKNFPRERKWENNFPREGKWENNFPREGKWIFLP